MRLRLRGRPDYVRNFAEGEGAFEYDRPYDEQAVEEKQDVGEGKFTVTEHKGPLSAMGLFVCVFVFGRRSVIGCFAVF